MRRQTRLFSLATYLITLTRDREVNQLLADRIIDFGNLAFIALTLSQLLDENVSIRNFSIGSLILMACYGIGYNLAQRGDKYA